MSTNLGGSDLGPGAANPEVALNERLGRIDAAITDTLTVDLSAGNGNVTLDQAQQCVFLQLNDAAVARDCVIAACKRIFFVRNSGSAEVTLVCGTGEVAVPSGETAIVRLNGTTNGLFSISSGGGGGGTPELPTGGDDGQILAKASAADGDVEWIDPPSGGGGGASFLRPPTLAVFPHTRNGTGVTQTQSETDKALVVTRTDAGSNSAYRYAFKGKNVPAGSSWDVIAGFRYNKFYITNSICVGLGVRLASTDRMLSVRFEDVNGTLRYRTAWHIGDSYQTALSGLQPRIEPAFFWTKINWNGTEYKFYISGNFGATWLLVDTRTAASYITADQVGIFVETYHDITTPDLAEVNCVYYQDSDYP